MESDKPAEVLPAAAPVEVVDQQKDLTPSAPPPQTAIQPAPAKVSWETLGFQDDEMEKFAVFISDNLRLVLDAAQGTNLRLLHSLNSRIKELEEKLKDNTLPARDREKLARDYRETMNLALKASNQVTTSGYTRIKAIAKTEGEKRAVRKPGFVKKAEPAS